MCWVPARRMMKTQKAALHTTENLDPSQQRTIDALSKLPTSRPRIRIAWYVWGPFPRWLYVQIEGPSKHEVMLYRRLENLRRKKTQLRPAKKNTTFLKAALQNDVQMFLYINAIVREPHLRENDFIGIGLTEGRTLWRIRSWLHISPRSSFFYLLTAISPREAQNR